MKKIIAVCTLCTMLFSIASVNAKEILGVKTTETEITVTADLGADFAGAEIGVELIKPRKTISDLETATTLEAVMEILDYADQLAADENGEVSFTICPSSDVAGYYTAVISAKGRKLVTKRFAFASVAAVNALIKSLTAGDADAADAESLFDVPQDKEVLSGSEVLSLSDLDAYKNVFTNEDYGTAEKEKRTYSEFINALKGKELNKAEVGAIFEDSAYRAVLYTIKDAEVMLKFLDEYKEKIGFSEAKLYASVFCDEDYFNEDTKEELYETLTEYEWESGDENDAAKVFDEIIFMIAVNAVSDGYGKIGKLIELGKEFLEENGADFTDYSTAKQETVWRLVSGIDNISEFVETLNEAIEDNQKGSSGGGGGGSSGGKKGTVSISGKEAEINLVPALNTAVFEDVENLEWAREAILALNEKGIVTGKEEDKFCPHDSMKRSEFLKVLMMALSLIDESAEAEFSDVPKESWYYRYVASAYTLGIVNGYGESFKPDATISREEAATMISRSMGVVEKELPSLREDAEFGDYNEISDYARDAVSALYRAEIINGMSETEFQPKENITRAQAVKMIYGLMSAIS